MLSDYPYHEFMFRADGGTNLDALRDLREGVEELPKTTASFRVKDVVERHPKEFTEEFFVLIGSWPLPERISMSRTKRYVNPNHVHRGLYSDISVTCDCGALMVHSYKFDDQLRDYPNVEEHKHTDDCTQENREDARTRLLEERADWLQRAADLYLDREKTARRMGVAKGSVYVVSARTGIDWADERRDGREKMQRTWRLLHDEGGHTYKEIAAAFGKPYKTVRNYAAGAGRANLDFDL